MRTGTFPLLSLSLAWLAAAGWCEDDTQNGKQLIMLEIERLNYPGEDKVVKRQASVQYGGAPDRYIVRSSGEGGQQQVPPEYLTLLHQLSPQQNDQQRDIQQLYITRNPQEVYAEYANQPPPPPPRPKLTPEQEQMRRLQEDAANKHIREQQERALQRALQTGQFQPGFQPQPYQPQQQTYQQQPSYQQSQQLSYQEPQPSYQQQSAYQQPQQPQSLSQYDSASSLEIEPQYSQPPSPPQFYQQTRSIRPAQAPQKFSYSQVQFGSSELAREALEPRLVSIQQKLKSQAKPQPQPQYYSQPQVLPQPQALPQPRPQVRFNAYVQPQQQTPTQPQHPQQYLIETTRPEQEEEQVVMIPRPRKPSSQPQSLYYRPQPAPINSVESTHYAKEPQPYTTIPREYQTPQQYRPAPAPQYVRRPQNLPSPDAPSRSAIYVQQSGVSKRVTTPSPPYNPYSAYTPGVPVPRIPTPQGHRPLTATEIHALSKAGFQISPLTLNSLQESSDISPAYDEDSDVYRSPSSKRQSQYLDERKPPGKYPKRIPKPVPLTDHERKLLAEQGIRNLYRVESSESKDAPVTYVLAIDNSVRKRESESATKDKN
ncbi:DNA translocase FtsK-like [Homalodisca vitripennis]|uniref:DNA translocase FtsK-like n=1 Tax=Homalodisca vitripennis TaxID=197043 RepID=UPI001EEBD6F1|nr:DNA translocase FtsK-like [Homalodisca vitripennis]